VGSSPSFSLFKIFSNSKTGCMKAYPIIVLLRIVAVYSQRLEISVPLFIELAWASEIS
jgi:hypothetical protein